MLLSGFVLREPAPYELYMVGLIAVWALFGLRISRTSAPSLLTLLVAFNIGGMISMTQMADLKDTPLYIAVSLFLAFTAVFLRRRARARPDLYRVIFNAYVIAAIVTSMLGVLGYFHAFPGAEIFTHYERARRRLPGPQRVRPVPDLARPLSAAPRAHRQRLSRMPLYAVPLLIIVARHLPVLLARRVGRCLLARRLSCADAACSCRPARQRFRLRIIVMSMHRRRARWRSGAADCPADPADRRHCSRTRAKLVQDYDGARLGRFARHCASAS